MEILGIDIGGSGIKGAPVNVETGQLTAERFRLPTPQPATPKAVSKIVAKVARHFNWHAPIGITFPAVVQNGITMSAANVDERWIGAPAQQLLAKATGCPVLVLNDADAAGIAEITFGAGKEHPGTVMILTLGTGIGSAIFVNGVLVPNTELGHLEMGGMDAEDYASDRVRKTENLSWKRWGKRVNKYLALLERLFSPDLFIIGGGVSKKFERYAEFLTPHAPVMPAELRNEAGIVGAAMAAAILAKDTTNG